MQQSVHQEVKGIFAFIAAIWVVFLLEFITPLRLTAFGVTPRTLIGLVGIPVMPFLHGSLQHITSNTVPLVVLLILLAGSKARSWEVVVDIIMLSGSLLWICGRHATHLGASGLVFGLIAFLIVSGWLERRFVPLAISVLVTFIYGGSLMWGVVPQLGSNVSWDGHLFGAIAGGIVAYYLARRQTVSPKQSMTAS